MLVADSVWLQIEPSYHLPSVKIPARAGFVDGIDGARQVWEVTALTILTLEVKIVE